MRNLSTIDWIAMVLTIIGGVNWGLVGFFGFNLVAAILGDFTAGARIIYALVGISALYLAFVSPAFARRPVTHTQAQAHRPVQQT